MSRVTPWLGFPGFGVFPWMSFVLRTCFTPVTTTSFDVRSCATFFMTDRQPFNIQERLIAYVWVHERRRRRIPDSTNLHVMSEGYQLYGLAVADMCIFIRYFPNLVAPSLLGPVMNALYISGRSLKILVCGINKVYVSVNNLRFLQSAMCRLLLP